MQIPSRQDIKDQLTQIATKAGYSGSAVELIISMLSTGYYQTLLRSIGLLREGFADTAANINSLITLAGNRMYSVFRGKNAQLTLKGRASKYQELKRGTCIYKGETFNLYIYRDTILNPNSAELDDEGHSKSLEIPLIISTNFINKHIENDSNRFFVDYHHNISEDFWLYDNRNQDPKYLFSKNIVKTYTNFREFTTQGGNNDAFELTIQDFGVRFFFKYYTDINVTLEAFEYYDIDSTDIDEFIAEVQGNPSLINISNFEVDETPLSIAIDSEGNRIYGTPRESLEEIKQNFNNQIYSLGQIRSKSDLLESFNLQLSKKIKSASFIQINNLTNLKEQLTIEDYNYLRNHIMPSDDQNADADTKLLFPAVIFYFIPKDNIVVTENDIRQYRTSSCKYYYLTDHIYACSALAKVYNITITLKTNLPTEVIKSIDKIISSYTYKPNTNVTLYTLQTAIAKLDNVKEFDSIVAVSSNKEIVQELTSNTFEYLVINYTLSNGEDSTK